MNLLRVAAIVAEQDLTLAASLLTELKRKPSGPFTYGENKIVRSLVENYGVAVAEIARQVGISTSGVSKILTRTLSI